MLLRSTDYQRRRLHEADLLIVYELRHHRVALLKDFLEGCRTSVRLEELCVAMTDRGISVEHAGMRQLILHLDTATG